MFSVRGKKHSGISQNNGAGEHAQIVANQICILNAESAIKSHLEWTANTVAYVATVTAT